MGNYISCTLAAPLIKNNKAEARVIFPGGEVRRCREPVNAAELMFECPNFFLVNSRSLHIGRRFSALSADEELEFGHVYIMFPMKRVNSMVTAADMAVFFMAANSAAKRISGGKVGILPESGFAQEGATLAAAAATTEEGEIGGSRLSLDAGIEELSVPEFKYRLSVCRSRKPLLETIKEEPISLR
ncbi:uncharacterized protein LOC121253986 [Juglans microcarpa x Juglans regia]|uniref:uncharacterized protein LOC121253986 n=1 Tax=Juglans microcarpa x Juglans regia TaxID=2249226 RepID=UPI001B7E538F|nr:uncharacterized protein LOC121253986 [Juglans microcarpa x Juglans regia]